MILENKELERLHTEMNSLLSERQGELARSDSEEKADDKVECEKLSNEISDWEMKAKDVPAVTDEDSGQKALELEARNICSRIKALCRI